VPSPVTDWYTEAVRKVDQAASRLHASVDAAVLMLDAAAESGLT